MTKFAKRLKELRTENKLLQKQLGERLNLPQNRISQWENAFVEPNIEQIIKLSQYFNVSVDYLLGNADDFGNIQLPEPKEELAPSERELLEKYRAMSADGKGKALDFVDLIYRDEERKRTPGGKTGVKWS